MHKGDCAGALERFAQAYALVAAPTIGVLEARCMVKVGRLVDAADKYEQTRRSQLHKASPRAFWIAVEQAERELAQLRPRIPRLKIVVSGVAPDAAGLKIELDGAAVAPSLLGVEQPIDPGEHAVVASLGADSKRESVKLAQGELRVVELRFEQNGQPAAAAPLAAPPPVAEPQSNLAVDAGSGQRAWGYVALAVGGLGVAAGGVTGAIALDTKSRLDDVCTPRCPRDSEEDIDTFRSMRTASWIGFGVGIAGVGLGLGLLLTADNGEQPMLDAWLGPGQAGVRGAF